MLPCARGVAALLRLEDVTNTAMLELGKAYAAPPTHWATAGWLTTQPTSTSRSPVSGHRDGRPLKCVTACADAGAV